MNLGCMLVRHAKVAQLDATLGCLLLIHINRPMALMLLSLSQAYGWTELLLGSVADECTQHSKFPVVVVRDWTVE